MRFEKIFDIQNYSDDQKNFWRSRTGIERTSLPKKKKKIRNESECDNKRVKTSSI